MKKTKNLELKSMNEVLEQLELLKGGYTQHGNWTLGQNCQHIATMMRLEQWIGRSPVGWLAELLRLPLVVSAIGRTATRIGIRLPAMPFARPKHTVVSDRDGLESLRAAIDAQQLRKRASFSTRFHLWHCSHHLGFLTPTQDETPDDHPVA